MRCSSSKPTWHAGPAVVARVLCWASSAAQHDEGCWLSGAAALVSLSVSMNDAASPGARACTAAAVDTGILHQSLLRMSMMSR